MRDAKEKRRELREKLASDRLMVAPGAHNALVAKLIEDAGFPAVYMTGSGVVNTLLGQPDVGLVTQSEMTAMAHHLAEAVDVPVISDADTGYGNAINVMRTVREFESAGVAAIHIEDQINPKRCGHIVGKELVSAEEMIGKLKAAVDARRDPDFVLIARTDARGPAGLDEAIARANRYHEAGADVVFPDALLSEEEIRRFAAEVPCSKMMNMGGYAVKRTTPKLPLETVEEIGFNLVIFPLAVLRGRSAGDAGVSPRPRHPRHRARDRPYRHASRQVDRELVRVLGHRRGARARGEVSSERGGGTQVCRREGLPSGLEREPLKARRLRDPARRRRTPNDSVQPHQPGTATPRSGGMPQAPAYPVSKERPADTSAAHRQPATGHCRCRRNVMSNRTGCGSGAGTKILSSSSESGRIRFRSDDARGVADVHIGSGGT